MHINMKYNININQKAISELSADLDILDAAILDYIIDICNSSNNKIVGKRIKDTERNLWTWVDLQQLINEMPLLKINTRGAIARRISGLEKSGFIGTRNKNIKGHTRLFIKLEEIIGKLRFDKGYMDDSTLLWDNVEEESTLPISNVKKSTLLQNNVHVAVEQRETPFHVALKQPIIHISNTYNKNKDNRDFLPPPPEVDIFTITEETERSKKQSRVIKTLEVIGMFSTLNKDYLSFGAYGPQRTAIKKLINYAASDGIEISALVQMAKDLHGVEYAPQIFTPVDMVSKYSKLIAFKKKTNKSNLTAGTPYVKGKYEKTTKEIKI